MPGNREKGTWKNLRYSYPEPAQVPLGEKPKARRENPVKGTRQIRPVPSA